MGTSATGRQNDFVRLTGAPVSGYHAGDISDEVVRGGGSGDDLRGLGGHDRLFGGAGADGIFSQDVSRAGIGTTEPDGDTLDGGAGNDGIYGAAGDDVLRGDGDDDTLSGAGGNDTMHGGRGGDRLMGGDGRNALFGGDGADVLDVRLTQGGPLQVARGGSGFDTLEVTLAGDGLDLTLTGAGLIGGGFEAHHISGFEQVILTLDGSGRIRAGAEDDILRSKGEVRIVAGDGDDSIWATGRTTVHGGDDDDSVSWGVVEGGRGAVLLGGRGDTDSLSISFEGGALNLAGRRGVVDSAGTVIRGFEEVYVHVGGGADIRGSHRGEYLHVYGGGNVIAAGRGNDSLASIGSIEAADILRGGCGDDTFFTDSDALVFGGRGDDYVDADTGTVHGGQGRDTISLAHGTASGGAGADVFYGKRDMRILDFQSGLDTLRFLTFDRPSWSGEIHTGAPTTARAQVWLDVSERHAVLWWDPDGTGTAEAVRLVTLDGVTALAAGDVSFL